MPITSRVAIHSCRVKESIRFCIKFEDQWRPIFWLQIGPDASIYAGPRLKRRSRAVLQKVKTGLDNQVKFPLAEGEVLTDPKHQHGKVSFHGSGAVNIGGDRAWKARLTTLNYALELCFVLFEHPRKFLPVDTPKGRDIFIPYPIDERRPYWANLSVYPSSARRLRASPLASYEDSCILQVLGVDGFTDMLVEFKLCHGPTGVWTPETFLAVGGHEPAQNRTKVDEA